MRKAIIDIERCKGCELCVDACPTSSLEMTDAINKKGYTHVGIDSATCIGCGICYTICPDGVFKIVEEV